MKKVEENEEDEENANLSPVEKQEMKLCPSAIQGVLRSSPW